MAGTAVDSVTDWTAVRVILVYRFLCNLASLRESIEALADRPQRCRSLCIGEGFCWSPSITQSLKANLMSGSSHSKPCN